MAEGPDLAAPSLDPADLGLNAPIESAAEEQGPAADGEAPAGIEDTGDQAVVEDDESVEVPTIGGGRYEVLSVLGEGGFGIVYKGRQISTGQAVAVKLLHSDLMQDEEQAKECIARFEREMRVIGSMKHPNVVRLIDQGVVENGELFMTLEFIDGRSLFEVLAKSGPLSIGETMHLMLQVLDALHAAHSLGIVHRDLKPQNIMLTSTGYRRNAMVLDFGIAGVVEGARGRDYRTLTKASEIRGTPSYMAPEQLRSKKLKPQIDVYAWGLTFLECLTGHPLVDAESPFEIALMQVADDPVVIPDGLIGDSLRAIMEKCVAKDVNQRFASAAEVFQAFEELDLSGVAGAGAVEIAVAANPNRKRDIENAQTAAFDRSALGQDTGGNEKPADPERAVATMMMDSAAIERHLNTQPGISPDGEERRRATGSVPAKLDEEKSSPMLTVLVAVLLTLVASAAAMFVLWPESPPPSEEVAGVDLVGDARAALEDPSFVVIRKLIASLEAESGAAEQAILARLHTVVATRGWAPPKAALESAQSLATAALAVDKELADAHLAQALATLHLTHDHVIADESFKAAVSLDPTFGADYASEFLAPLGRGAEAKAALKAATAAAPESLRVAVASARVSYLTGDFDQAVKDADAASRIQSDAYLPHLVKGLALGAKGDFIAAQAALDTARAFQDESSALAALGYVSAKVGDAGKGREILKLLIAKVGVEGRVLPEHIAWIQIGLGEHDAAVRWIEKAVEAKSPGLVSLRSDPVYAPVLADERVDTITVTLGIKSL